MFSRFHAKLLNLGSGDLLDSPRATSRLPRLMNDPGFISPGLDTESSDSDTEPGRQSTGRRERMIIVANFLPLISEKDSTTSEWRFKLDEDSLLLQLKDGFSLKTRVIYVGRLKAEIDPHMQDEVAQKLYKEFHCMPTFLAPDVQDRFYHGFCKNYLWPLFHYMLPLCPDHGDRFDRSLWQAYVAANKTFADTVMEVIHSNDDYVWAHDYHLLLLPTFLRKRLNCVKLGFFLHSPFPSSEIYRTLPVRDEILKGLLNADLIGFHTFDYARHFLSCCSRMLGLDYESKRGYIGLEYYGRTVNIKILPVGIHMGRLESVLKLESTAAKVKEIEEKFEGKTLILGVDDMDVFKGISLKLQAVEELLRQHPFLRGKLVMVQIVNPARSSGKDVQEAKKEADEVAKRVNKTYGFPRYNPVVMIDQPIDSHEKIAFYSAAECCIVNAVRDGMNLVPYKYVVCRQGTGKGSPQTSALVVSEFVGCSPSLSGAIRVNPWNIEAVAEAIYSAITLLPSEKQLRHEKHYNYIRSHDIAYWARSFLQDLERSCKDHYSRRCWGIGLGLGFRVVALSPSFRKLSVDHIVSAYKRTKTRAIFLDYDGTVMPRGLISKSPSGEVISIMNGLCNDPQNTVFIVSGRGRSSLNEWFDSCENLGIAAEHGYFLRWRKASDWVVSPSTANNDWRRIAEPVMKLYTETTDGSSIESKESALVWHHQDADHDFGSGQAKELLDHLENVLANEPVVVKRGQYIVEVKPEGLSKGLVAESVLKTLVNSGKPPDFVMCIGDDRSDEDMFESIISAVTSEPLLPANLEVFACTVGRKPTKAKYYLDDTVEVVKLLKGLASASIQKPKVPEARVSFECLRLDETNSL